MKDTTGKKCLKCKKGIMREMSLFDDWEGFLTCTVCKHRSPRWVNVPVTK